MMEESKAPDDLKASIAQLVNASRLIAARELCVTSRDAYPRDPWLATMQAYVFLLLGDSQRASQAAAEALALGSDDPLAVLVLGTAQRNRGLHAEAAEMLLTASRQMPDRLDAASMAIEETVAAHGVDRGREVYSEIFARLPDHSLNIAWGRLLFDAGIDTELPDGVASAPVMSVPAWLARTGAKPEFLGVQETIPLEVPPIFGEPGPARFKASVPGYTPYACSLRGATIFAKSSIVLTDDGCALNDMIADERFGRFLALAHDETVLRWADDQILLDLGRYEIQEIEAGVMLSGWASQHFGHWLPEFLGRLPYLERHPRFAELPIIVDSDMPPQHLEYLRALVSNPVIQIPPGGAFRCGELIVGSPATFFPIHLVENHQVPPEHHGGFPTESLRFLRERVLERLPPVGPRDRKIYLSRKDRQWRRLLNEDEISAALAAQGFEVLLPEELSFEDQVRMYQSATVVVAPNGSSLLNAIFAPKDLQLIVLSQRGLFNWATFYGPMRELGYDMVFLCGDEETQWKHGDYHIPLPRLTEALGARR